MGPSTVAWCGAQANVGKVEFSWSLWCCCCCIQCSLLLRICTQQISRQLWWLAYFMKGRHVLQVAPSSRQANHFVLCHPTSPPWWDWGVSILHWDHTRLTHCSLFQRKEERPCVMAIGSSSVLGRLFYDCGIRDFPSIIVWESVWIHLIIQTRSNPHLHLQFAAWMKKNGAVARPLPNYTRYGRVIEGLPC